MAKVQKAVETLKTVKDIPFLEVLSSDPAQAMTWLFTKPGFWAIAGFFAAFFFKVFWDVMRDNSRETAKVAMLNMFAAFSKDQHDARLRNEEKLSGLISKLELNVNQNNIDMIKLEYTLSRINDTLASINKRVAKIEGKQSELG